MTGAPRSGLLLGAGRAETSEGALAVEVLVRPITGLSLRASGVPIVDGVRLRNVGTQRLDGATWSAVLQPGDVRAALRAPVLHPGEEVLLSGPPGLQLPVDVLLGVRQVEPAMLQWEAEALGQPLGRGEIALDVLPWDGWPADRAPPGVLASFVLPDDPVVGALARRYGGTSAEPVATRIVNLHRGIRSLALKAADVPPGFDQRGMRLRMPDTVLRGLRANAYELALLYAGCLERMDLGALLVASGDRLLAGAWVVDERFPEGTVFDASRLRAARSAHQLLLLDPAADPGADPTARAAAVFDAAEPMLADDAFRYAIDLRAARADGWLPLPARPPADHQADARARPIVAEVLSEAAAAPAARATPPAPAAAAEPVAARFRQWKERLLDLSLRNRLLAFKTTARTSIPLEVPDPGLLVERLLADAVLEVLPAPDPAAPEPTTSRFAARPHSEDETLTLRTAALDLAHELDERDEFDEETAVTRTLPFRAEPAPDGPDDDTDGFADEPTADMPERADLRAEPEAVDAADVDPVHLERVAALQADRVYAGLPGSQLMAHVVALDRATRLDLEEGGANTLYAAVGFLRWSEAGAGAEPGRLAPLLLVPVVLEHQRRTERVRIRRTPDDPVVNVTLVEKLRRDFDLDLSALMALTADDGPVDVAALLEAARAAVAPMPRWRVEPKVALGQLLFTKFLMWRDLEDNADWLLESPVVQHIARRAGSPYPNPVDALPVSSLDDRVGPEALPLVVDADSTQIAAVDAALRGRSFVLQGPPGTGKSQTITNLVAVAIATGRTVLVVAEKLAALDVVHRRLHEAGLGHLCLELHSHKTNKRQAVTALAEALRREPATVAPQWEARSAELSSVRQQLNGYVRALHGERPLGATFRAVSARMLDDREGVVVDVDGPGADELAEEHFRATVEQAARFATAAAEVEPVAEHPWRDTRVTRWSAATEQALAGRLTKALQATDTVQACAAALAARLASRYPPAAPAPATRSAAAALAEGPCRPPRSTPGAPTGLRPAEDFADRYATWQARSRTIAVRWHPGIYRADLARLVARFGSWPGRLGQVAAVVMLLFPRRELAVHCERRELPDNRTIAADLSRREEDASRSWLPSARPCWPSPPGPGAAPNTEELRTLAERGGALLELVRRVKLPAAEANAALAFVEPVRRAARRAAAAHRGGVPRARGVERAVQGIFEAVPLSARSPGGRALACVRALQRWSGAASRFRAWAMYGEAAAALGEAGLRALVDAHCEGRLSPTRPSPSPSARCCRSGSRRSATTRTPCALPAPSTTARCCGSASSTGSTSIWASARSGWRSISACRASPAMGWTRASPASAARGAKKTPPHGAPPPAGHIPTCCRASSPAR
ncbi:MAG: DUF4011 domain-containing protein [Myxococcota bacterium]